MTFISQKGQIRNLYCSVNTTALKTTYSQTQLYVEGSQVDYTPPSDCQFVEYRYQAQASFSPDVNDLLQFSLKKDDTVSLNPETQITSMTEITGANSGWGGNQNSQAALINLRFTLPAWQGTRRLALGCQAYNNYLRCTLHWTDQFRQDDVDAVQATTNSFRFSPHLIIYSY